MADEVGVAYVTLMPSARGFKAAIEKEIGPDVDTAMKKQGEQASQSLAEGLKSGGGAIKDAGAFLMTRLTAPIVATGGLFIKVAGDFEAAMNGVRAITGATGADFDALRDKAKRLGETTQFSASQAAAGMEFLGMAGWDTQQILTGVDDVLNLAAASGMGLADAADIASNVMSGFNIEAEEAGRVADVLASVAAAANTDVYQLGEAMKYAAPLASAAGWSLEETAAAVGFLGNAGIQGSMAGTGLNQMLSRLADTSSAGAKKLAGFGVAATNSSGAIRPLTDLLDDLADAGADVGDVMSIFGLEGGPKLQALLGQGTEGLRELIVDLEGAEGAAQRMADIRMEGFAGGWLEMKSAFEGFILAVADSGLLDWATALVNKLTGIIQKAAETSPEILKIGTIIAGVAAAIGPVVFAVGAFIAVLGSAISTVGGLTAGTSGLSSALSFMLGPWGLVIAVLVAAFASSESFREAVMGLIGVVMQIAMVLIDALMPAFEAILSAIVPIVTIVGEILAPILNILGAIVLWLVETVIAPLIEALGTALLWAVEKVGEGIMWLVDNVFVPFWNHLKQVLGPAVEAFARLVKAGFDAIVFAAKWLWEQVKSQLDKLKPLFTVIGDWVKTRLGVAKTAFTAFVDFIKGIPGKIKAGLSSLPDKFKAPFKKAFNAVASLWNGTVGKWSISIPSWVPEIGGKSFSMPKIPTMAQGGVLDPVRGGVLGVLAEAGVREYALPEPKLEGLLGDAVRAGSAAPAAGGVTINAAGLDRHLLMWLRSAVKAEGGGNVQRALGRGPATA